MNNNLENRLESRTTNFNADAALVTKTKITRFSELADSIGFGKKSNILKNAFLHKGVIEIEGYNFKLTKDATLEAIEKAIELASRVNHGIKFETMDTFFDKMPEGSVIIKDMGWKSNSKEYKSLKALEAYGRIEAVKQGVYRKVLGLPKLSDKTQVTEDSGRFDSNPEVKMPKGTTDTHLKVLKVLLRFSKMAAGVRVPFRTWLKDQKCYRSKMISDILVEQGYILVGNTHAKWNTEKVIIPNIKLVHGWVKLAKEKGKIKNDKSYSKRQEVKSKELNLDVFELISTLLNGEFNTKEERQDFAKSYLADKGLTDEYVKYASKKAFEFLY